MDRSPAGIGREGLLAASSSTEVAWLAMSKVYWYPTARRDSTRRYRRSDVGERRVDGERMRKRENETM